MKNIFVNSGLRLTLAMQYAKIIKSSNFTEKFMWDRFDLRQWNKYLTYHQSLNNGINLPEEDVLVIIHNYDDYKYYIGRFSKDINGEF